jgi:hypothetical protein
MKKALVCLSICMFIFAAAIAETYAAESFTYSETLTEKLKKYTEDGDSWWDVLTTVKYSIAAKVSTNGIDISKISNGTFFSMSFGDLYVEGNLSVINGKKSTVLYDEYECNKVSLKWDKNYLTIKLSSLCTEEGTVLADYYYGETGPVSDSDEANIFLENDSLEIDATFDVTITGKVTEKTVIKYEEEYYLESISLKGKGVRAALEEE